MKIKYIIFSIIYTTVHVMASSDTEDPKHYNYFNFLDGHTILRPRLNSYNRAIFPKEKGETGDCTLNKFEENLHNEYKSSKERGTQKEFLTRLIKEGYIAAINNYLEGYIIYPHGIGYKKVVYPKANGELAECPPEILKNMLRKEYKMTYAKQAYITMLLAKDFLIADKDTPTNYLPSRSMVTPIRQQSNSRHLNQQTSNSEISILQKKNNIKTSKDIYVSYTTFDNRQESCLFSDLKSALEKQLKLAYETNTHFPYFNVLYKNGHLSLLVHNKSINNESESHTIATTMIPFYNLDTNNTLVSENCIQNREHRDILTAEKFQPKLEEIDILLN